MIVVVAAAFLLGVLGWTLAEYLLHRFVGHGPRRPPPPSAWARLTPRGFLGAFNDEHLRHHADARYFAPTSQKVVASLATVIVFGATGTLLVGPLAGPAFAAGFSLTYAAYEVLHRRIHTHPPRGPYGRWSRRHHLLHHFKTPRLNHGVTSPLWDKIAGTERRLDHGEPLRVPRHLAPPWITDDGGAVRSELARDYVVAATGGGQLGR